MAAYFNYDDDNDDEDDETNTKMCIEQAIQNIEKFKHDFDIPNPTIIPKPKTSETDKKTEEEILRERIAITERQLKDVLNNLKNNEAERLQFETEICEHLKEFSTDPYTIMSNRRFFNICKFESKELPDIGCVKDSPPSNETKSYKAMTKEEFVQREMNKLNPNAPNHMTDEEKTRLNTMLSDSAENEETDDEKVKEQKSDDDSVNAFEIFQDEKEYLNEIEAKLKTLETNPDENRDNNVALTTNDWLTIMKEKDEKLKEIDRKLRRIKEIDEKLKQTENKVKLEIDKIDEPFTNLLNLPLGPEEKQIIEKLIAEKIAIVKQSRKTIGEQDVPTVETNKNDSGDYFTADEKQLIETIKNKQNN